MVCPCFASAQRWAPASCDATDVRIRIRAEFAEMPGLCLTLAQAARFFSLDRAECERMLAELVRNGELTTDGTSFRLAGTGRHGA